MSAADRELRAETTVAASPQAVWGVLSDPREMPRLSDELVRMVPLGGSDLRPGRTCLGVNRRGPVVWPTRSVVAEVEPGRLLSWDTLSSGARWIWELEPVADDRGGQATRVVHRRPVPERLTRASGLFAGLLLGGAEGHADELEAGMARSVARLKERVESLARGV